MEAMEREK